MLIDSHCHLNFSAFAENYKDIIADCLKNEIGVLNVGSQFDTSKRAIEIANEFPNENIYASIGIHPIHLSHTEIDEEEIKFKSREENFDEQKYQELIDVETSHGASKIVAIGEIGLDYFHEPTNDKTTKRQTTNNNWKELQKQGLIAQLNFAQKNNLPVILHARGSQKNPQDAYLDLLKIISENKTKGVLHCFGSTPDIAKKFVELGFYIGFTGIITFKNKSVEELRETVRQIPLNKILVETDAPYLTPEPQRGKKNEPQYVEFVARKVAELKNVSIAEVKKQTTKNFENLFL